MPTCLVSVCGLFSIFIGVIKKFLAATDIANYARVSAFSPLEVRNTAYAHIQKEIEALEAVI